MEPCLQSKAGFEHALILLDLVVDLAAGLNKLEAVKMSQCLASPLDCGLDGILDAGFRATDRFNVVAYVCLGSIILAPWNF
jgi:hypothetical protein